MKQTQTLTFLYVFITLFLNSVCNQHCLSEQRIPHSISSAQHPVPVGREEMLEKGKKIPSVQEYHPPEPSSES